MTTVFYTCSFVPRELIAACGLAPCRLAPAADADERIEGLCSFVSAWLDHLEYQCQSDNGFIAVFSSCCDQMRRAFDLYTQQCGRNTFLLNAPSTATEQAFQYYVNELRRLTQYLCTISGTPLDWNRLTDLPPLPAGNKPPQAGISIALTGGPAAASVLQRIGDIVQRHGAEIVSNTTESAWCADLSGFNPLDQSRDPLETLARAYSNIPAIWKRPNTAYFTHIRTLAEKHRFQGLILLRQSFCDLWHGQGYLLRKQSSLPVLELDLDGKSTLSPSAASRIEAFVETLR